MIASSMFDDLAIIKDFNSFLGYFGDSKITLTNSQGVLRATDLLLLNELMSKPVPFVNNKSKMADFKVLTTFFYIAVESGIFLVKKDSLKKKHFFVINPARKVAYDQLENSQKYFTLLEGFYQRIDWDIAFDCRGFWGEDFCRDLLKEKIGVPVTIADRSLKREGKLRLFSQIFFLEVLSAFGFFELEWDRQVTKKPTKYLNPYRSITNLLLGAALLPVLIKMPTIAGLPSLDFEIDDEKITDRNSFYKSFKPLLASPLSDWDVSFFEKTAKIFQGSYVLKIALDKKLYRTISISSTVTLEDLHLAIQSLYQFDNDHLYAFFMDGNRYSMENAYYDERAFDFDGYFAIKFTLGELDLYEKKEFLYVFDFGDSWEFLIQVIKLESDKTENNAPYSILEEVGKAPKQYHWEDD